MRIGRGVATGSVPLAGEFEGFRSARRGDYWVIVRLDDQARVVILHWAADSAHAYRPG